MTVYYEDECDCGTIIVIEDDYCGTIRCNKCKLIAVIEQGEIQHFEEDHEYREFHKEE